MATLGVGKNPLEQRAIDAHVRRLGIEAGEAGAVEKHRAQGDLPENLDLDALGRLRRQLGLGALRPGLRGVTRPVAQAQLAGSRMALDGARGALRSFADRIEDLEDGRAFDESKRLSARMTKTAEDFDKAVSDDVLAFARPEDLEVLAESFHALAATVGEVRPRLAAQEILPVNDALETLAALLEHADLFAPQT
ncbi:MAG: hypothetical protein RIT81_46255 [Deltaproteobacteria bacterium]